MSGISVIWHLLKSNGPITAIIPAAQIFAGDAPLKTPKPLITVMQIGSVPFKLIRTNEANKLHSARVQVTFVFNGAHSTPQGTGMKGVDAMGKLVLAACPSQRGTVNSIVVDSIVPDVEGPDLSDPVTDMHSRSRDFIVKWVGA